MLLWAIYVMLVNMYILYVKLNFEAGIKIKILCLNTTSGAVYRLRG